MPAETSVGFQILTDSLPEASANTDGELDLALSQPFIEGYRRIAVGAHDLTPGVTYTLKLTLDRTDSIPLKNALFRIKIFLSSSDPTVEIYDDTSGGTKIGSVTGFADSDSEFNFIARFNGVAWEKYDGRYVV